MSFGLLLESLAANNFRRWPPLMEMSDSWSVNSSGRLFQISVGVMVNWFHELLSSITKPYLGCDVDE